LCYASFGLRTSHYHGLPCGIIMRVTMWMEHDKNLELLIFHDNMSGSNEDELKIDEVTQEIHE